MAIDPRIPLGVTPMQLESPTEQMGKAMNLRAAQAQMQSSDLDLQAKERALAEEQQLKALIQSGQPLSERNLFPVVGPVRGASILKGLADLKGAQVKTEGELRAVMGSVIGAIKSLPETMRPLGYQTAREGFIQRGWARPEDIPEQYSPELLDQFQQQAMTAEQQTTGARADARFAAEQPGIVADSAKKATQAEQEAISLSVSRLQAATNQAEWDIALADAPPAVKRQIPKTFSRAAVSKAQRMGMTADKALGAENDARRTSETARHNRVMETAAMLRAQRTGTREVTPTAALAATRSLRNDFLKETGAATEVNRQLGLMEESLAAVKGGSLPAGSQGILVTFQKILDPTSVVRESEYARSAQGLSLMGRLQGKWQTIQQGGAGVTVKDLEDYVELARQFAERQKQFANSTKVQIDGIADEYGLKKELITRDIETPEQGAVSPAGAPLTVGGFTVEVEKPKGGG